MRSSAAVIARLLVSLVLSETFLLFSNAYAQTPVPPDSLTPAPPVPDIVVPDTPPDIEIPPAQPPAPPAQAPPATPPPKPPVPAPPATQTPPPAPPVQAPPATQTPPPTPPAQTPAPPTPPATPTPPPAAVIPAGESFRFLVALGLNYATVSGSELDKVDPGFGIRATGAMRLFSQFSACASIARNSSSAEGQVVQILDRYVRPDRRSGSIVGDVTFLRVGVGGRLDAVSTEDWKYRPYVQAEFLIAKTEFNLDSVDGAEPVRGVTPFSQTKYGALGRAGVDFGFTPNLGIEVFGAFEIIEFPAGSASLTSLQGGGTYRF